MASMPLSGQSYFPSPQTTLRVLDAQWVIWLPNIFLPCPHYVAAAQLPQNDQGQ